MPDPNIQNTSASAAADAAQLSAAGAEVPRTVTLEDVKNAVEAAFVKREQQVVAGAEEVIDAVETKAAGWWAWLRDQLRATPLLVLFAIAFFFVVSMNEAKIGLTMWGIARVPLFAWLGYRIDRIVFGRLKGLSGIELGTAWKRRAIIVAAAMVSGAMLP